MAVEKLSQITSGGATNPSTDVYVGVRNGNTDVLLSPGVTSFNGRTGAVVPVAGDYTEILNGAAYVIADNGGAVRIITAAGTSLVIDASGNITLGGTGDTGIFELLADGQLSFEGGFGGAITIDDAGDISITPASGKNLTSLIGGESAGDILYFNGTSYVALAPGTSGQVLTQGASNTPEWATGGGGSGTVNSGTQYDLAYYAASGTAVSGLSTAANGVLVTSSGSVPSISSTLPGAVQGNITQTGKVGTYNGVTTAGNGLVDIVGYGRSAGATGSVTTVTSYVNPAADGSYEVSANVNITTSGIGFVTVSAAYTDETNTSRTADLTFSNTSGTFGLNCNSSGPYMGIPLHIRVKASTSIVISATLSSSGTTYNVEGVIKKTD